jgi:hypothetical protein
VPTATGPKGTGDSSSGEAGGSGGSGGGQPPPLEPAVADDLRQAVGNEDAERLEEVATSTRFGAPAAALHAPDEGGFAVGDEGPDPLSAAVSAFGGEGGASLLPLVLALAFATGALTGAAVMRRRGRSV